ncbi:MAG: lipoyl(octanoyl) transferase LipB [Chitinophagaceae bacterium]|nr:MAG: lipoyl(octanoyl) transferase LipB [Chitinophagaceae bacterium]
MEKQKVEFRDLEKMDYKSAWDYQDVLMKANLEAKAGASNRQSANENGELPTKHYLLFVEHPPVYTLGKSGKMENLLINEEQRKERGIEFYQTNRGGDITFHGPEQIVGYPILDLEKFYTDIGRYLRELEEVIILTLAEYDINAGRSAGETGVWIDADIKGRERKICAMGVRCSRWITMHGFALNVNTDLSYFNHIIPCGIQNKKITSIKEELGRPVPMEEVKKKLKRNFEKVFNVELGEEKRE